MATKNIEHFFETYPSDVRLKSAYEEYSYKGKSEPISSGKLDGDFYYEVKAKGHPEFTCYGEGPEMLDYIFCSEKLNVVKVLKIPDKDLVTKESNALPNSIFPSDHLRIEAIVQL